MIHFCTSPTDCNEVSNFISSLNHKTVRPINQSLSSGIFSKILKTRKIIVHEKDYEIKKLSILIKPLKESCITDFTHSLKNRTHCSFQTGLRQKYATAHPLIRLTELIRNTFKKARTLGESLINGFHPILLIEIILLQLVSLIQL